jgi:two-component system, chemotaxis family, CheB/CheR fusion protein
VQERNLQLRRALDFTNAIVETVRDPLLILDGDLRVERASQAFYDIFRVAPEETVGRRIHELGQGQWNIPELRRALEEVLPKDSRFDHFEVEHDFPHIGRRSMLLNGRRLRGDNPQESILLAIEDQTEARKLERAREGLLAMEQEARKRAEDADRIKDEFVATLSHELRGPLNSMVGWVHIVHTGGIDEATRERGMAAIERAVKAQARMIEELLDYSRMVTGKLQLLNRMVDLVAVTTAAVESARVAAEAKEVSIELSSETKTAMVRGDPDRLQQVAWNLLSNAVKFTPRGGRVQVCIGRVGTYMHLTVRDTGRGIPRDFLPHVFERFRQGEGRPSRTQTGLGLGLAIVKQLVEQHGGTVAADSTGEGQGATFTIALPVPALLIESESAGGADAAAAETVASEQECTEPDRSVLEGLRVLIVEDDPDSREMLVAVLQRCGAKVSEAASASEAIEAVAQGPPDLLVCDIGLPDEDGYSLMSSIRKLSPDRGGRVRALALTAYTGPDDRDRALAAGFDMYLGKPAEPSELLTKLAALASQAGMAKAELGPR